MFDRELEEERLTNLIHTIRGGPLSNTVTLKRLNEAMKIIDDLKKEHSDECNNDKIC